MVVWCEQKVIKIDNQNKIENKWIERKKIYLAHGVWMNEPGSTGCLMIIVFFVTMATTCGFTLPIWMIIWAMQGRKRNNRSCPSKTLIYQG